MKVRWLISKCEIPDDERSNEILTLKLDQVLGRRVMLASYWNPNMFAAGNMDKVLRQNLVDLLRYSADSLESGVFDKLFSSPETKPL